MSQQLPAPSPRSAQVQRRLIAAVQHNVISHPDRPAMSTAECAHTGGASAPPSLVVLPSTMQAALDHPLMVRVAYVCYVRAIWISLLSVICILAACQLLDPHMLSSSAPVSGPLRGVLVVIVVVHGVLVGAGHLGLARELGAMGSVRPWSVWNMYLTVVIYFASVYLLCFSVSRSAFSLAGYAPDSAGGVTPGGVVGESGGGGSLSDRATYNDTPSVFLALLYFSAAIQTSTGFGDIIPASAVAQLLTNTEMLLGLVYHAGVFGLALDHFMRIQGRKAKAAAAAAVLAEEAAKRRRRRRVLLVRPSSEEDLASTGGRDSAVDDLEDGEVDDGAGEGAGTDDTDDEHEHELADPAHPHRQHHRHPHYPSASPLTPGPDEEAYKVVLSSPLVVGAAGGMDSAMDSPSPGEQADSASTASASTISPYRVRLTNVPSAVRAAPRGPPQSLRPRSSTGGSDDVAVVEMSFSLDEEELGEGSSPLYPFPSPSPSSSPSSAARDSALEPASRGSRVNSTDERQRVASSLEARATKHKSRTFCGQFALWRRLKRSPRFERLRRIVIDWMLLIELLLQMLSSSLMFLLRDPFTGLAVEHDSNWGAKVAVLCFASILLAVQLALNVGVSLRLLNKIASGGSFAGGSDERGVPKQGVTASFLTQSYLSTVLVYASIYFFLFAFTPSHQFSRAKSYDLQVVDVWFTFVYFSVTVMTGCGFGDIFALGVLSRLVALTQMLISILYACIIIGLGMFVMCEQMERKARDELLAKEKAINDLLTRHSGAASHSATPLGGVASASAEPPLLELLHHPEWLEELKEPVAVVTKAVAKPRQTRASHRAQPAPFSADLDASICK